jgi:tetratricopeptide (TPR) repeat protein
MKGGRRAALLVLLVLGLGGLPSTALALADEATVGLGIANTGTQIFQGSVTIGVPAEQLESLAVAMVRDHMKSRQEDTAEVVETQKKLISRLEKDLELNERQVRAALEAAGETEVAPEQIAAKLVEIANEYKKLLVQVQTKPGEDPRVAELKGQVNQALRDADLDRAKMLLHQVKKVQTESADRLALDIAATAAQLGGIALAQLRYREAADLFAEAAGRVPPGHDDVRGEYRYSQARALYRQGDEKGDNAALVRVIVLLRDLLETRPRERAPLDWAKTQAGLGSALRVLGEREGSPEKVDYTQQTLTTAVLE